jgi:hypothetical protein
MQSVVWWTAFSRMLVTAGCIASSAISAYHIWIIAACSWTMHAPIAGMHQLNTRAIPIIKPFCDDQCEPIQMAV